MTVAVTDTTIAPAAKVHPDATVVKPKRDDVIVAYMHENRCGLVKAQQFLAYVERIVEQARSTAYRPVLIFGQDYYEYHDMLKQTIPAHQAAKAGSSHDLTERFVLDPARGELGLTHGLDDGECSLRIEIRHA